MLKTSFNFFALLSFSKVSALTSVKDMIQTAAERRDLAKLDTDLLRDIGINEAQRSLEVARPFWDTCK